MDLEQRRAHSENLEPKYLFKRAEHKFPSVTSYTHLYERGQPLALCDKLCICVSVCVCV